MKRIFSAGGIVVKEDRGPKVLVTQHSGHHGWDFPKGHIEKGETSEQAAIREVEEETGVRAEIIEKIDQSKYFYIEDWDPKREKVFKTVTFFLMKYLGEGKATTAEEVSAIVWLDPSEVERKLTFKGSREVWRKAEGKV
ncbi:NUDIX domain-containing protein [Candidatus Curtissbacteria bacterium]|nr:NUDIX domain-containing protein [Candidatus Curtissbacteria bacterium]